jgi:hypothetical protein
MESIFLHWTTSGWKNNATIEMNIDGNRYIHETFFSALCGNMSQPLKAFTRLTRNLDSM